MSHHDSNETIHIMIVRWSDDFEPNNIKKNKNKVIGLKIYRALLKKGKWSNVESLPFNSDDYNVAHPALNLDENFCRPFLDYLSPTDASKLIAKVTSFSKQEVYKFLLGISK